MIERIYKKIFCFLLIVTVFTTISFYRETDSEYCFYGMPLGECVVVIDAGHGGEDGGAIGISTLTREKEINLKIAQKIGRLLESAGATVFLTRNNDDALCKDGFNKMEDMLTRKKIINDVSPYAVISVHCNSFPTDQNARGAQTFYYPESETGKLLAECIQSSVRKNVDASNNRTVKDEDFFMLRHGNGTNVMIECGFLSCKEEELLLLDEAYQDKIAYAVFDGFVDFVLLMRTPANI